MLGFARSRFPKSGGAVLASREDGLAVAAEGRRLNRARVLERLPDGLPGTGLPEAGRTVVACQNGPAVGAKSRAREQALQLKGLGKALAGGHLPALRRVVPIPYRPHGPSVRVEAH